MTIRITGTDANDEYGSEDIENVELISIEPNYMWGREKKDKIFEFIIKYKKGNEIIEEDIPNCSEISYDSKENRLEVYYDCY